MHLELNSIAFAPPLTHTDANTLTHRRTHKLTHKLTRVKTYMSSREYDLHLFVITPLN